MLADGGAIADWTLAADWFVAVGTVGAAVVATGLGLRAIDRENRIARQAGLKARRQVFAIYDHSKPSEPTIEIVNGSEEAVTMLFAQVGLDGNPYGRIQWNWDDASRWSFPTWPYLLSGERVRLQGTWEEKQAPSPDETPGLPIDDPRRVIVQLFWADSNGDYWARSGQDEPYVSTAAMPFRYIPDFVPAPSRHWWERLWDWARGANPDPVKAR